MAALPPGPGLLPAPGRGYRACGGWGSPSPWRFPGPGRVVRRSHGWSSPRPARPGFLARAL